ncbi:MAG TPA: hypothetical protein VGO86_06510 [Candidatus Dormibacteraeota bacterium]
MVMVEAAPDAQGWRCAVEVAEGAESSRHAVRVRTADLERWGRQGETAEQFVSRAFAFLLAREPASQILRSFEVADISRYFPEFDREIRS